MNRFLVLRPMMVVSMWVPGVLSAQGTPNTGALSVTAENLMSGDSVHKALARTGQSTASLLPGDEMRFQFRFTNTSTGPVKNVRFANPVPPGLRLVAASAKASRGDVGVEYSIDGGKSYSSRPMMDVLEEGKSVRKPAPPERFTDVRWIVSGTVPAGGDVTAEYRATLRTVTKMKAGGDR